MQYEKRRSDLSMPDRSERLMLDWQSNRLTLAFRPIHSHYHQ